MKRTKIVCTIGPTSDKKNILTKMIKAGMNVARLNMSHGSQAYHQKNIKLIRQLAKQANQPIAIIADLQGPRIRVGILAQKGIDLKRGQSVIFTTKLQSGGKKIPVTYAKMHKDLKPGQRILIADGIMEFRVEKINGQDILAKVVVGGFLTSSKGINLPDTQISLPALSIKDKKDVQFGVKNGVDFFALSFVRSTDEILALKNLIARFGGKNAFQPKIIAKIERPEAVDNIKAIIEASDGIMVARGDLGIELPVEDVPLIQKDIINICLKKSKPVIVATQMLESMVNNLRPTRAEVSDVANAVIDHTDAVMLSGETANGKYPVEAVATMAKIIIKTEKSELDNLSSRMEFRHKIKLDDAVCYSATVLAKETKAKLILVASLSGYTARLISRYRPELPILVATNSAKVRNQLNLDWGVVPFVLPDCKSIEQLLALADKYIKVNKYVKAGDKIIVVAGQPLGKSGNVNWVKVQEIK
jgi:pyruvate kinase